MMGQETKAAAPAGARHPTNPGRALGLAFCFTFFLYVTWVVAWLLEQAMEQQTTWMATGGERFAYWTVMKLVLWVLPATVLVHASGQRLRDTVSLRRVRSTVLWGGGIGIALMASALITKAVAHRPLFCLHWGWSFIGGVIVAPIVEEFTFRGAVLPTLLIRYRFVAANTVTALLFTGVHLPGWYFQGRLSAMLTQPIGGAVSILLVGWVLGMAAYKGKSVAASTLAHILNNLFSAS